MELTYKIIEHGSADFEEEVDLRDRVLRQPLGLAFTDEELDAEQDQIHIGAYTGDDLVGCLILVEVDDRTLKMRQVAVEPELQGQGIGQKLVSYSEYHAIENGYCRIEMHARETAVSFYEDLGYEVISDEFIEVGIPHYKLEKDWCTVIGH